ncbi:hypothetical protein V8G54_022503 [Vigna mungo]|uniref:Uncharacterized protein n=1 Tax=Vigna mungo TaxID=3915 RepID=A0AAQ3RPF9_VIGMU
MATRNRTKYTAIFNKAWRERVIHSCCSALKNMYHFYPNKIRSNYSAHAVYTFLIILPTRTDTVDMLKCFSTFYLKAVSLWTLHFRNKSVQENEKLEKETTK